MLKRIALILLTLTLLLPLSSPGVSAATAPSLSSESVIAYSVNTGDVLYEKNADKVRAPASLTKIVTTMVVLETCTDLDKTLVTVPDASYFADIYAVGGSNIALEEGEVLTVRDLLYAVMLPSACDACTALAHHFGNGDISAFTDKMNEWAKRAGAVSTNFENAHGLDEDGHVSTARDISKILFAALKNETFNKIIRTFEHVIPENELHGKRYVSYNSTIPLLNPNLSDYYPGLIGVKSGYTLNAKCCLSTLAQRGDETFLVVCMGAKRENGTNYARVDTVALYNYLFANYETRTLKAAGETIATVALDGATSETEDVVLREDLKVCVEKNGSEPVLSYELPERMGAPFSEIAGTLTVRQDRRLIATRNLYFKSIPAVAPVESEPETPLTESETSEAKTGFFSTLGKIFKILLIAAGALIVVFLLLLFTFRVILPPPKKRPLPPKNTRGAHPAAQRAPQRRPIPPTSRKRPPQNNRRQG